MKKCPMCAEEIQEEAIKCKHCGSVLPNKKSQALKIVIGVITAATIFYFALDSYSSGAISRLAWTVFFYHPSSSSEVVASVEQTQKSDSVELPQKVIQNYELIQADKDAKESIERIFYTDQKGLEYLRFIRIEFDPRSAPNYLDIMRQLHSYEKENGSEALKRQLIDIFGFYDAKHFLYIFDNYDEWWWLKNPGVKKALELEKELRKNPDYLPYCNQIKQIVYEAIKDLLPEKGDVGLTISITEDGERMSVGVLHDKTTVNEMVGKKVSDRAFDIKMYPPFPASLKKYSRLSIVILL